MRDSGAFSIDDILQVPARVHLRLDLIRELRTRKELLCGTLEYSQILRFVNMSQLRQVKLLISWLNFKKFGVTAPYYYYFFFRGEFINFSTRYLNCK